MKFYAFILFLFIVKVSLVCTVSLNDPSRIDLLDENRINSINCGRRVNEILDNDGFKHKRIIGGNNAHNEDWGWQVSLNFSEKFVCGGSLINSQWVLTAASCLTSTNTGFYTIDIGLHDRKDLESWAVTKKVKKIIKHSDYSQFTNLNDIALLKLSEKVTYSKQIVPVCIPDGQVNYSGREAWATGFGTSVYGGSLSRYLQEVNMTFFSDARCIQKYGSAVHITNHICAGENGKDICQGDFGGPLVIKHKASDGGVDLIQNDVSNNALPTERWYLVGVSSFGRICGEGSVYTRTTHYYNWIKEQLKLNAD